MTEISLETVAGKLNRLGYDAFMQALRHARGEGNRNVELAHWLHHLLANERSDLVVTLRHFGIDPGRVQADIDKTIAGFRRNVTEMPGISAQLTDALDRGWHYATLLFGEAQIRSGHVLVAILRTRDLARALRDLSPLMATLDADQIVTDARTVWADSDEEDMRPMDGSGLGSRGHRIGRGGRPAGQTALGRFSIDMTAQAESGKMDPIVGRDEEIRQIIDVLMRRRQNNPILTGEAGVGKTAVVEGFAQALVAGNVPPALRGVRLHALDIGLMQAGRLDEGRVRAAPALGHRRGPAEPDPDHPVHRRGAHAHRRGRRGGHRRRGQPAQAGAGARHAAHRRRHHLVGIPRAFREGPGAHPPLPAGQYGRAVDRPGLHHAARHPRADGGPSRGAHLRRGGGGRRHALGALPAGAATARQGGVALDTASARVTISQSATPAMVADLRAEITALETERAAKTAQADLGETSAERLAEIDETWPKRPRRSRRPRRITPARASSWRTSSRFGRARHRAGPRPGGAETRRRGPGPAPEGEAEAEEEAAAEEDADALRDRLRAQVRALEGAIRTAA